MHTTIFSENLKQFRLRKNLTQEQAAQMLGVGPQTISRWECGNTLPDVLMLPEIARLYEVTVDDFYKKNTPAYRHYASRLSSVYEKTRDPEDFMLCLREYDKLMKVQAFTTEDKWNYAIIHHFMMTWCKDKAMEWYNKAKDDNPAEDPHAYYRARDCRSGLFYALGRSAEYIAEQEEMVRQNPDNVRELCLLIGAYYELKRYQEAYDLYRSGIQKFSEDWMLYIYGGESAEMLDKLDEALACFDKAGELGTAFHDELYCKADFYRDHGDKPKAREIYLEIARLLRTEGYDVEADMAEREAAECLVP